MHSAAGAVFHSNEVGRLAGYRVAALFNHDNFSADTDTGQSGR